MLITKYNSLKSNYKTLKFIRLTILLLINFKLNIKLITIIYKNCVFERLIKTFLQSITLNMQELLKKNIKKNYLFYMLQTVISIMTERQNIILSKFTYCLILVLEMM